MVEPRPHVNEPSPGGGDPALDPTAFADADLDLTCPGCGASLAGDDLFATFGVCASCERHFPLPPRERLALLVDPGGFVETNAALLSLDPLLFHDQLPYPDRLAEAQELLSPPGLAEGVITGVGTIGGVETVIIVLDLAQVGGAIGALAGEKITLALEQAAANRLPVVAICASGRGPGRSQDGLIGLAQLAKIASVAAELRRTGVPMIAVLAHPTSGGVYVGLANQADFIFAEPGARIGYALAVDHPQSDPGDRPADTAEALLARGHLDGVVARQRLRETIASLLDLLTNRGIVRRGAGTPLRVVSGRGANRWEPQALARHPERPTAASLLPYLVPTFVELHGDRVTGDDRGFVCGLGRLAGLSVAVVAQTRDATSGGPGSEPTTAEGLRKVDRVMRLASRFDLPIAVFIDGRWGGGPEIAGTETGLALAQALGRPVLLPVAIVTVILGEAGGVASLALGQGDRILMLEHAVVAVSHDVGSMPARRADSRLASGGAHYLTAQACQRLGFVDVIVPEPAPAAHADPAEAARLLEEALACALDELIAAGDRRLLATRARRLRTLGMTTPEGRAATRHEAMALLDLHDIPRHLARSIGEWRERFEARYRLNQRLARTHLNLSRPDLAARIATIRANVAGAVGRPMPVDEGGIGGESEHGERTVEHDDQRRSR